MTSKMQSQTGQYSIVIPAWNESQHIAATLKAVQNAMNQQTQPGEIIVVDNNSTDDTAAIATEAGARVVFEPINQIAKARNKGAQEANNGWLVFVDADSLINAELLGLSLNALSTERVIGGGSTVAMDAVLTGLPAMMLRFWNWWSVKSHTAAGCYIYCKKEAFDHVGGFDETRFAAEELYFSKALRRLAKKRGQQFLILTQAPIVSSARKIDWYSPKQMFKQAILLLVPGSTRSRKHCYLWYDRSDISVNRSTVSKSEND